MSEEDDKNIDQHRINVQNLRKHILSCSTVSSKSEATILVLGTLDKELARLDRDEKLKNKFSKMPSSTSSTTTSSLNNNNNDSVNNAQTIKTGSNFKKKRSNMNTNDDIKVLEDIVEIPSILPTSKEEQDEDMEWQDINANNYSDNENNVSNQNGTLGKLLAEVSISNMSSAKVLVKSGLGALAVAIHGAIIHIGFVCTGIPEEKKTGFAPAVRDLPKNVYLPSGWNKNENYCILLRYRKNGIGTRILRCTLDNNNSLNSKEEEYIVSIRFHTTDSQDEQTPELSFPLSAHVNLHSFQAAIIKEDMNRGIEPALHYKALPVLLNNFCHIFDLGDSSHAFDRHEKQHIPIPVDAPHNNSSRHISGAFPCNSSKYIPVEVKHESDFASDLTPPSLRIPPMHQPLGPLSTGNLMGPDHPMFQNDPFDMNIRPDFGGMQPRFDPYGPPVPSIYPRGSRGRGRGRVPHNIPGGDPNPDHLRPPSDFDPSDLYM